MATAQLSRRVAIGGAALLVALTIAVIFNVDHKLFGGPKAAVIALRSCTIGDRPAQCGRATVPENPSELGGRKIALNVAVFRATGPTRKPDPLLWFSGWGGAGVTDDAASAVPALRRVNIERDLVFIDQRGTGSAKLACPLPTGQSAVDVVPEAVTAAARRCAQRIGPNLRYYTSAVAVDDFDKVREALGYDKVNLYGGSYGVTTGQIYLRRHRSHVRSGSSTAARSST
jgi:pimeloyl-ACP methyl ester carboxylesterase